MNAVALQDDLVDRARSLLREAIDASKGFPPDPRLEKAQANMVGALAELVKFQMQIGGPR